MLLGTRLGLFRKPPGNPIPLRAWSAASRAGRSRQPRGPGYSGPGELLATGHPDGGALPENLGLIRSGDAGDTWESVSGLGKTDYHILQVAGDRIAAVEAEAQAIRVSGDGGRELRRAHAARRAGRRRLRRR